MVILTLPNNIGDYISKTSLTCLGLLWCTGTADDKAEVLVNLIQEAQASSGGTATLTAISNDDVTLNHVSNVIMEIATITIVE